MPRLKVTMGNGDTFQIRDLPGEDTLAMVADFQDGGPSPTMTLIMDGDMVYLNRGQISSIEVEVDD